MTNKSDKSLVINAFYGTIYYMRDFGEDHIIEIDELDGEKNEKLNNLVWDILSDLEGFIDRDKLDNYINDNL